MLLTKKSSGGQLARRLCQGQCPNSLYFSLMVAMWLPPLQRSRLLKGDGQLGKSSLHVLFLLDQE